MNRGKLWIIPNEEVILQPVFSRDVERGISHNYKIMEFAKKYNLDMRVDEQDYHGAPCTVSMLGHMVVKAEDDAGQVIIYLPEVVTKQQLEWLINNQHNLNRYFKVGAYSLVKRDNKYEELHLYGMFDIIREATRKNMLTEKEERKR